MQFPEGYTRVEYIQSSGTQYIDTVFKPNQNTRIVMDAQLTVSGSKGQFFFGARGASYKQAFAFMYSTDGPSFKYAYNATSTKGTSTNFTARLYLDANKNVCSFNGESITITAGTFQSAINMYLFASNENGTLNYYATMRLYSCRIYDNGTLVRDFVPCKNSSGVAGLYDFANGVFYDNDGTGTFTAGPEIVETLKIVDAAELDAAISATAEAIRAKTGKTEKIAWNTANGFASAVSSIAGSAKLQSKTATPSASSQTIKPDSGYDGLSQVTVAAIPSTYKRVATGTFTTNSTNGNPKVNPISVSGLGFTPTRVIAYLDYDHNYTLGSADIIVAIDLTASTAKITRWIEGGYSCEYCEEPTSTLGTDNTTAVYATMFSGGFTINGTAGNSQFFFATGEKYQYVAIG